MLKELTLEIHGMSLGVTFIIDYIHNMVCEVWRFMECKICLFDDRNTDVAFDKEGVCNYCNLYFEMDKEYPISAEGAAKLHAIIKEIRQAGKAKKYDCIIGVSGGCDSSYLLYKMVCDFGLRPLAVNFDNTWSTPIADKNMRSICDALHVDFLRKSVDEQEINDIYKAFLKSGVLDIDAATDIGLIATLYKVAE